MPLRGRPSSFGVDERRRGQGVRGRLRWRVALASCLRRAAQPWDSEPRGCGRSTSGHAALALAACVAHDEGMRTRSVIVFALGAALQGCSTASTPPPAAPAKPSPASAGEEPAQRAVDPLDAGWKAFRESAYGEAESRFREALAREEVERAALGLAHVLLVTGRYDDAIGATERIEREPALVREARVVRAQALRRMGKLEEAEAALEGVMKDAEARRGRLLLGEILLEQGAWDTAEPLLMTLIEDYNAGRLKGNAFALAMVGRAAHLLESPHDANDAFNEAEQLANANTQTLLWRAELFLENYDQGHAEEVLHEILQQAPEQPEALIGMAHVKLAQTLDFDAARELAERALKQNPQLCGAYFVLAGIALRDLEFAEAERLVAAGLQHNPRDLDLLSMRAATRFLADDHEGFEAAKEAVLSRNPRYSRMFHVIGEYAEWEHRYSEIVDLMREALATRSDDPKIRAQLGFNLIRSGFEEDGVRSLQRAFARDPFNVRVFNTLELYEKEIPADYVTVEHGQFRIRYHKEERAVLDRYVPGLLSDAWRHMTRSYGFTPKTPVSIELYAQREQFAVRTSGLPQTFIQGVCFGQTLAAMSPRNESFNLGMTLWHELAHVFHIQLSNSRVPRWFTEGLAEYETIIQRPEWQRERDLELYDAVRAGRIPSVARMNEAFSRARDMGDMTTAYYASSQIATMLAEQHGMDGLSRMLQLWGQSQATAQVLREALGVGPARLDAAFRAYTDKRLQRYASQFVPWGKLEDVKQAEAEAKRAPSAESQARLAQALRTQDQPKKARKAAEAALQLDPKHPNALWIAAELAAEAKDWKRAAQHLEALVASGSDGLVVQMAFADLYRARKDDAAMQKALEAAHRFDPTQAAPLKRLYGLAKRASDTGRQIAVLTDLAAIEEHDPSVYRALLELLVDAGEFEKARAVGEAAIWVDVEGVRTHLLYGRALAGLRRPRESLFEFESATLCPGRPSELAEAHARLARALSDNGRRREAKEHAEQARALDPDNAQVKALPPL